MRRAPKHPPPHVLTLDEFGAGGLPLRVLRLSGPKPTPLPGPMISTFFTVFVLTAGRGRGRHLEEVDLHAGDIHIVPAGVAHQPLEVVDLDGWILGFDPTLLSSPHRLPGRPRIGGDAKAAPVRSIFLRGLLRLRPGPPRRQRIERVVAELEAELREAQWGAENAALAWFALLITEFMRELSEHAPLAPPMLSGLVQEALRFIEAHCLEPLSLQDVAAALGRTPSHVANIIRRETGLTVGDWLREHRMAEARRRLLETDASIETIADQVGYADVTHFIRTFRRAQGMTPRAFRERRRREDA
ncbi:helix-turn-helix transcriptional regulator [Polyangium sorediatum]|uniref:AraC family transcriptional regulator n=1 Tax=Polyangium sorediatum TaxID=889274 RepID=A0ABT6P2G9_9BACT|nr:AraC family transcriptional regulator [Polyangium sorediatum]MDI1434800.1 AraC family transcriptional regulator [Polyangium sorediatum]